jgi:hypothetical protein
MSYTPAMLLIKPVFQAWLYHVSFLTSLSFLSIHKLLPGCCLAWYDMASSNENRVQAASCCCEHREKNHDAFGVAKCAKAINLASSRLVAHSGWVPAAGLTERQRVTPAT